MLEKLRKNRPSLCAAAVIVLYAALSLYRLGYPYAPSTGWERSEKGGTILLDLGTERDMDQLIYYLGKYEDRVLSAAVGSGDPVVWEELPEIRMSRVYQWGNVSLKTRGRYLRLTATNQYTDIRELILVDGNLEQILPVNKEDYPELFDETWMYPGRTSIQAGTVFDESLFARTAYEYLHGIRSYEDTHPPLGKLMISLGIAVFGMTPFGWRISGVTAGVLLLVLIWKFARRLFKDPWVSVGTVALVAFDFLHFTESRLGQVDSFLVLFMTGMYYFMFRYYEAWKEGTGKGKTGWGYLAASGFFMGLAVSCKWSGFYGAAGLTLIWAVLMIRGLAEKKCAGSYVAATFGVSVLCFVLVPAVIYLLSYIPYRVFDEDAGFWERMAGNQIRMFLFHTHVGGYHPSGSRWYEWPLIIKPVMLYIGKFSDQVESLFFLGNPGFWWTGAVSFFFCLYRALDRKEGKLWLLLTGYLTPLLPWMLVSRYSFLYHYYPCLPFLALLMGFLADRNGKRGRMFLAACVLISAVLFVMFYPVISGQTVDVEYVTRWLEWLPAWKFTETTGV